MTGEESLFLLLLIALPARWVHRPCHILRWSACFPTFFFFFFCFPTFYSPFYLENLCWMHRVWDGSEGSIYFGGEGGERTWPHPWVMLPELWSRCNKTPKGVDPDPGWQQLGSSNPLFSCRGAAAVLDDRGHYAACSGDLSLLVLLSKAGPALIL